MKLTIPCLPFIHSAALHGPKSPFYKVLELALNTDFFMRTLEQPKQSDLLGHTMATPKDQTTSISIPESGLLRLPPELRVQIYKILASGLSKKPALFAPPYCYSWQSRKRFNLPITRVCRILREESIPIMYQRFWWCDSFKLTDPPKDLWTQMADTYAMSYMTGSIDFDAFHTCRHLKRSIWDIDARIRVKEGNVEVMETDDRYCCEEKRARDNIRDGLIRKFKGAVEEDGSNLKEELIRFIEGCMRS